LLVSPAAALAISDSFKELFGLVVDIKWPNDIQIAGKKISGILPDLVAAGSTLQMYLGIGINIKTPPDLPAEVAAIATSIEKLGLEPPSRELLLANLSFFLETRLIQAEVDSSSLIEDWKSQLVTLGKRIRLATPGGNVTGLTVAVTATGELILELDDGSRGTYAAGDVHTLDNED
jgi:BirA family biotin operon repressor/biotin-[acetyl-CoA-carboxylase] ligase